MYFEVADPYKDELTQVYNKKFLETTLPREIKKSKRYGTRFSLLLLDIDDFSLVNKLYGHKIGDKVLFSFAQFLKNAIRETDTIVRLSGDDFLIILPYTTLNNAQKVAERIITLLSDEDFFGVNVTASIGLVEIPSHGTEWSVVYNKLDMALYRAKKQGKGGIYAIPETDIALPIVPSPSFIGRKAEKVWILQKLNDPEVKIISITGSTGVGKTRLVEEALKLNGNAMMLSSKVSGSITSIPFYPFRTFFKTLKSNNYFNFLEALETLDEGEKVALSLLDPEIGFIPENIDRYKFFDAYSKILQHISKIEPIIMFIDDLHWLDSSSLELLYFLVHSNITNMKIIIAYRKEESANKPMEIFYAHLLRERAISETHLENLSKEETFELLEAILQGRCDKELADTIYQETGGNPFFIEELTKDLFKHELLINRDGQWFLREMATGSIFHIPETVENIIKEKMKLFDGNPVIEYAACLGSEFNIKVLELCTSKNPGELYDTIDKMIRNNILVEKGLDVFAFKEDITREIVLSKITETKKRYMHKTILETLEKIKINLPVPFPILSYHAYMAGETEKIKKYSIEAARELRKSLAYHESLKHYKWYLDTESESEKRAKVLVEYLDTLNYLGEIERGIREAKEFIEKGEPNPEILARLADFLSKAGRFEEAHKYIDLAISFKQEVTYKLKKAWIYLLDSAYTSAEKILKEVEKIENTLTDRERADFCNLYALCLLGKKNFDKSEQFFRKALELREKISDIRGVANVHLNLGNLYSSLGLYEKALEEYDQAQKVYIQIGDKRGLLGCLNNKGEIFKSLGEYEPAISSFKESLRLAEQIGDQTSKINTLLNFAEVHILCGNFEEAENLLSHAKEVSSYVESELLNALVHDALLKFYTLYKPNVSHLQVLSKIVQKKLNNLKQTESFSYALITLLQSFIALGNYEQAKKLISRYEKVLQNERDTKIQIEYGFLKATIYYKAGEPEKLKGLFPYLARIKREVEKTPLVFYFYEHLVRYIYNTGRKSMASKLIDRIIERLASSPYIHDLDRLKRFKSEILRGSHGEGGL
ncbi:MAG: diguanylate cyclase [candidate division WOR-3 bacterium]